MPARRVEEAQRAVKVAEARLTAAQARLDQRDETLRTGGGAAAGNSFVLRAPIAGRVAEVYVALGASYDEGAPLFRIVRTDRVELQALVPASEAPLTEEITEIALEVPGRAEPLVVQAQDQHDAGVIDEKTRSLPVQFDVDNRTGQLLIGQTATAILYAGGVQRMPVVPKEAVLMEAGTALRLRAHGGRKLLPPLRRDRRARRRTRRRSRRRAARRSRRHTRRLRRAAGVGGGRVAGGGTCSLRRVRFADTACPATHART